MTKGTYHRTDKTSSVRKRASKTTQTKAQIRKSNKMVIAGLKKNIAKYRENIVRKKAWFKKLLEIKPTNYVKLSSIKTKIASLELKQVEVYTEYDKIIGSLTEIKNRKGLSAEKLKEQIKKLEEQQGNWLDSSQARIHGYTDREFYLMAKAQWKDQPKVVTDVLKRRATMLKANRKAQRERSKS